MLGEFVEAGEYGERPYYQQRNTENNIDIFLYHISKRGHWFVSKTLGESNTYLRNYQDDGNEPPRDNWIYWDGRKRNDNDTSFTLLKTALDPCQLVTVAGNDEVVDKHGDKLGDFRSKYKCW